ncbi:MAG TPA: PA2169 family four-helix-bundle protein [Puia sp.]|jgi:uncharacterized protein (TIGR02284 family)|nr:PA2169 family four-helix-bundle protein [Puia sp.]
MQNTKDTIEVLNDLIQINNDRIAGYEKAIKETQPKDDDLKILYATMIAESHRIKIALATEVQTLGAEVEQGTTTSGKIYRAWMDVKAIFGGHDRHTVLSNCEAGEDAAQRAYRMALETDALPAYIRELLTQQQQTLKASHDEIKALRDQYATDKPVSVDEG